MMSTEPDQFEQRLGRQPLRQVPPEWREEILAVASRESRVESRGQERSRRHFPSTLSSQLSTMLWPHPVAWAGLAAVWTFIFVLDFSARDQSPVVETDHLQPPAEVMVEVRQQQQLLVELLGARDTRDTDRSKLWAPQPRSQSVEILNT